MSESARTITYAGVAVVSVIAAGLFGYFSQPERITGFDAVGTEFYPDFRVAGDADSMRVVTFDSDTATIRQFAIARKDNAWVIPSHYDYPADAADRLNKTANSILGIKKGAQKGSLDAQHKEFKVVDPLTEGSDFEGRGQRITLKKGDDVLVDYIIGKKASEEDQDNLYYVRIPKQPEVFLAEIELDLSTKFSDWIEDDLLKLDAGDLREVIVNKYSVDEQRGMIRDQEVSTLTREKSFEPWALDGLDEETEELKTTEINDMVSAIDDLKIVGVRPKPKGLNPDLSVDPKFAKSQGQLNGIIMELQQKGYFILAGEDDKPKLYANEGNLMAATTEGVVYTLNFGEVFSGSIEEIEIGASAKKDDEESGDEPFDDSKNNNRYLFVTATFDEKYLGEEPTQPAEPQMPEGLVPDKKGTEAPAEEQSNDGCDPGQEETEKQESQESEAKPDKTAEPGQENEAGAAGEDSQQKEKPETEEEKQKRLQGEWDLAQTTYKIELKKYEDDVKAFEKKVEAGTKRVADLNYRFGGWYYVISDDSFATLRLARTDLVKPKEKKEEDKAKQVEGGAGKEAPIEGAMNGKTDGRKEASPAATEKPKDDKPDDAASKADAAGGDGPPKSDPKANDQQPAGKDAKADKKEAREAEAAKEPPKSGNKSDDGDGSKSGDDDDDKR